MGSHTESSCYPSATWEQSALSTFTQASYVLRDQTSHRDGRRAFSPFLEALVSSANETFIAFGQWPAARFVRELLTTCGLQSHRASQSLEVALTAEVRSSHTEKPGGHKTSPTQWEPPATTSHPRVQCVGWSLSYSKGSSFLTMRRNAWDTSRHREQRGSQRR